MTKDGCWLENYRDGIRPLNFATACAKAIKRPVSNRKKMAGSHIPENTQNPVMIKEHRVKHPINASSFGLPPCPSEIVEGVWHVC
jgi:hypothetical protein